jgi:hypothetical protein
VALADGLEFESIPIRIRSVAPLPLQVLVSSNVQELFGGDVAYIRVTAENVGPLQARGVTARLIDLDGNLGVLVQELGDIPVGGMEEWVFAVEIPDDYPVDRQSTFFVQTVSEAGLTSESAPLALSIGCRPDLELRVEPPTSGVLSGRAADAAVMVENTGPCVAQDVRISLEGLPVTFARPPAQDLPELPSGATRQVRFNLLAPQSYRGEVAFWAELRERSGRQTRSEEVSLVVGTRSTAWSIVLGLLAIVAVGVTVTGTVLHLRNR